MFRKRNHRRRFLSLYPACVLLLIGSGACSSTRGHDAQLTAQLTPILTRHADTGATVSARVIDLDTGRELYAYNIDESVMPASNMKIVTASVALDTFGPDHTFNTYLHFDGHDLWITGTGDPAIGDAKIAGLHDGGTLTVFDEWVAALKAKGITSIPGDIKYFDGAFDNNTIHPSWSHDDLVHWYAAPVSGLNFNDNCVDVTVFPKADGEPAGYEVVPPFRDLTIVNECVSGNENPPTIERLAHANVLVLGGGCTKRRGLKSKPVIDPGAFFADAFREHLIANGISVAGDIASTTAPPGSIVSHHGADEIAVNKSRMSDVMWRLLKDSQNLFAECLCKLSGREYEARLHNGTSRPGSWESGERAARAFMREHAIDDSHFVGADGSGLSRDNRVTVRLISDILVAMHNHPYANAFRNALAEPGESGTLGSRMKDLSGHVFAKTGYIRGVRALSGYVHTNDDRWLCFSIIYNNIPGSVRPFNDLQDEVCHALYDRNTAQQTANN
ncbi:MAG: D-alanyl-D-alanine carboxypeptidase/D-alanyl-D-alanine-endopeptidase [Phycisphaerales bacterium]|nr:D-alanyl-D-alanine carboxypeptidase/D-alanyl-D-alanine-endopeptidase [Phycisphaerales bacterium]